MTVDPLALRDDLRRADDRLLATVAALTPESLAAPSLLPDWSRSHVLSHLARNADSLNNLLTWARTGVETPAYPSPAARAAGIEAGAGRPLGAQLDDLRDTSARFLAAVDTMPTEAWAFTYRPQHSRPQPGSAAYVVWRRLREVEVHHVDLGLAYGTKDWPAAFTARLLRELVIDRPRSTGDDPVVGIVATDGTSWQNGSSGQIGAGEPAVTVSGPAYELAGWLAGRTSGSSLTVSPHGPLPTLSAWM
ncbi:MAG TPA: maleylpyruvate isomerase family mycothiol-dependent enzyme [Micromonosporaceae bacterium]